MKKTAIVKLIQSLCAVFCAFMLLWLAGAGLRVTGEYEAAASYQNQENLNPFKADSEKKSWDVRSKEVKAEFADGSWAVRIASGNADKTLSVIIIATLVSFLLSSVTSLIFVRFVENKKAKARAEAESLKKAKAEADARRKRMVENLASGRLYPKSTK